MISRFDNPVIQVAHENRDLDYFAAHALTGLIARYDADALIGQQHAERWAKVAYLIAAQMIKERENHERH